MLEIDNNYSDNDKLSLFCHTESSSTIESFSYFGYKNSKGQLTVKFKNGSIYRYDVTSVDAIGLVLAESVGSYFSQFIKTQKPYVKVS
jgi:hypothetical protein